MRFNQNFILNNNIVAKKNIKFVMLTETNIECQSEKFIF